jgi:hypothetical protein
MVKPKSSQKKSDGICLDILGTLIWCFLTFLFPSRRGEKKAKALVDCVFSILVMKYPEYFEEVLMESSQNFANPELHWHTKLSGQS